MNDQLDSGGRDLPANPPADDDPTLGGADPAFADSTARGTFPDTVAGARLVLFQRGDGAIEVRWRLDPHALGHARAAFAADAAPRARLVLKALDDGARVLAGAELDDTDLMGAGTARYEAPDTEGTLQAEIGFGDGAGGWMLVGRSNRLEAAGPVGADFLRENGPAQPPQSPAGTISTPAAVPPAPVAAPVTRPLELQFPLVQPVIRRDAVRAGAPPHTREPATGVLNGQSRDAYDAGAGVVPPRSGTAPSGAATAADSGAGSVAENAGPMRVEGAVILTASGGDEVPAGAGSETIRSLSPAAPGQPELPDGDETRRPARGGSGPILRPRPDQNLELHAELTVYGSAPPGQLVKLGGHHYQVGPGGRFVLRVPVTDPALIEAVLARLDGLPVPARDTDENET
jgi:hypothetical protein